jgi:hypothetical protein
MRFVFVAVVLVLAGALAGCSGNCEFPPCPLQLPALTLLLRDAVDGGAVTDGVINGQPCQPVLSQGCAVRTPDGGTFGAGLVVADVTAPGYQPSHLEVQVPAAAVDACSCAPAYVPQTRTVPLTHL